MSVKKFTKKQLSTARRNRKRLADAIRRTPRAPPQTGLLGQAFNVLRRNPDAIIDASSYALSPRGVLEAADRAINTFEEGQRVIPGPVIAQGLRDSIPNIDEVEQLIMAAADEELLDENLVNAVIQEIETGRDVIRRSNQFRRDLILPSYALPTKRTRKKTKTDKNMSKALRMANERFRKKNGQLRKGATQAKIMKYAHKLLKKM